MNYPCPCCKNLTLSEPPPGTFEVCPVCYWEDDAVQFKDPTYAGGANRMSLEIARSNYQECGVVDKEFLAHVRKPLRDEVP
jgi:hypothetical protein